MVPWRDRGRNPRRILPRWYRTRASLSRTGGCVPPALSGSWMHLRKRRCILVRFPLPRRARARNLCCRSSLPVKQDLNLHHARENGARLTRTEIRNVEVIPRNARYKRALWLEPAVALGKSRCGTIYKRRAKHNMHIESESRRRGSSSRRFIFCTSFISLSYVFPRVSPETF